MNVSKASKLVLAFLFAVATIAATNGGRASAATQLRGGGGRNGGGGGGNRNNNTGGGRMKKAGGGGANKNKNNSGIGGAMKKNGGGGKRKNNGNKKRNNGVMMTNGGGKKKGNGGKRKNNRNQKRRNGMKMKGGKRKNNMKMRNGKRATKNFDPVPSLKNCKSGLVGKPHIAALQQNEIVLLDVSEPVSVDIEWAWKNEEGKAKGCPVLVRYEVDGLAAKTTAWEGASGQASVSLSKLGEHNITVVICSTTECSNSEPVKVTVFDSSGNASPPSTKGPNNELDMSFEEAVSWVENKSKNHQLEANDSAGLTTVVPPVYDSVWLAKYLG